MKMFEEIKEYTKEFEGILEMKKDIDLAIDSKLKEKDLVINKINEKIEEKGKKINSLINDFIRYNKALNDINITMKEIQFKENTNKMDIIKINSKLKKKNEMQDNGEKINNTLDNERKINNIINDNINKKNSYEQSINCENISPIKNEKLPNEGINLFKESLMKGKTLLNKRSVKDNIFYIRKKKSEKLILEQKEKSKNSEKEIDNKEHTSNEVSYTLLYNNTINQKNMINNKFDFSISSIKNKLLKNNVTSTENNMNKETIESTENKKQMSFKRNSNSDYKSKKNNQNYSNMFKINNIKKSQINYKMHGNCNGKTQNR
jgi:hypothetical protein